MCKILLMWNSFLFWPLGPPHEHFLSSEAHPTKLFFFTTNPNIPSLRLLFYLQCAHQTKQMCPHVQAMSHSCSHPIAPLGRRAAAPGAPPVSSWTAHHFTQQHTWPPPSCAPSSQPPLTLPHCLGSPSLINTTLEVDGGMTKKSHSEQHRLFSDAASLIMVFCWYPTSHG